MLNRQLTSRRRSVNMFAFFLLLLHSRRLLLQLCQFNITLCYFLCDTISYLRSCSLPYYSPPALTPTNDNSLIHPLSISHFYDEPNRIPSHRLSFNVLPFMVIQLIHILVRSQCFSRRPRSMARPHRWRLMPRRGGITALAKDKKQ